MHVIFQYHIRVYTSRFVCITCQSYSNKIPLHKKDIKVIYLSLQKCQDPFENMNRALR